MECFRIDESGYTGFDLLNRQQRLQGAAAIAISDEVWELKRSGLNPAAIAGMVAGDSDALSVSDVDSGSSDASEASQRKSKKRKKEKKAKRSKSSRRRDRDKDEDKE